MHSVTQQQCRIVKYWKGGRNKNMTCWKMKNGICSILWYLFDKPLKTFLQNFISREFFPPIFEYISKYLSHFLVYFDENRRSLFIRPLFTWVWTLQIRLFLYFFIALWKESHFLLGVKSNILNFLSLWHSCLS